MKIGAHFLCEDSPTYTKSINAIVETASQCAERIQELAELGVTEISSAYLNNEFEQIGRVGQMREII